MPAQALDFMYSSQASAEHFKQCAEFLLLRNRGLGPIAATALPIPLARRGAAAAKATEAAAPPQATEAAATAMVLAAAKAVRDSA
jgi:hypothetical protein